MSTSVDETALVHLSAKANFAVLGPRLGADVRSVAAAIAAWPSDEVEAVLEGATRIAGGHEVSLADIVVERAPRDGVVVASDALLSVALETELDTELRREGIAREVIAVLQRLRRDAGFAVSDRVTVTWASDDDELASVFDQLGDLIGAEVLATSITRGEPGGSRETIEGTEVLLKLGKA